MLLDFNLAQDIKQAKSRLGGTPEYMAPEKLRAWQADPNTEGLLVDPAWDIFALGVILYELLTGRLPFGATSPTCSDAERCAQLGCAAVLLKPVPTRELLRRAEQWLA
jgi:serine/threonine protein kinase